jgi:hypothetical protein
LVPARLVRLRELTEAAAAARSAAEGDGEIIAAAERATDLAGAERSRVPLLGAQEATIAELIGPLTRKTTSISYSDAKPAQLFAVFDGERRCRGIYIVGSQPKARGIPASAATLFLSQVLGRPATLKVPAATSSTSRWVDGGVGIVARWSGKALAELRIGDAAP